jgi:hypothetical protein
VEIPAKIFSSFTTWFILGLSPLVCTAVMAQGAPTPTPATTGLVEKAIPTGVSLFTPGTPASGTVVAKSATIYGGYTGAFGGCAPGASPSSTSTCSSCDGSGLTVCSQTSIHPNLFLTFTMSSSTAASFTGTPKVRLRSGANTTTSYEADVLSNFAVNQVFTAQFKWGKVCQALGGDDTCTNLTGVNATISVGIDSDNDGDLEEKVDYNLVFRYVAANTTSVATACPPGVTAADPNQGICDYAVTKGDEKVYIHRLGASGNALATGAGDVKFNRVVLFYKEGTTSAGITNNSKSFVLDLKNNDPAEPEIVDPRLRGLQNDHTYCFVLANMDQTGIISRYPDASVLANTADICATPANVVGLLDDKSCFIATATFGSPMAPEVVTFRQFRNQYLLTNSWGKAFVKLYYKYGPIGANWISHSDTLKTVSLGILWPLLLFVKLSLALGMIPAALIILLSAVVFAKLWTQFRRTRASTL